MKQYKNASYQNEITNAIESKGFEYTFTIDHNYDNNTREPIFDYFRSKNSRFLIIVARKPAEFTRTNFYVNDAQSTENPYQDVEPLKSEQVLAGIVNSIEDLEIAFQLIGLSTENAQTIKEQA